MQQSIPVASTEGVVWGSIWGSEGRMWGSVNTMQGLIALTDWLYTAKSGGQEASYVSL
jgi:hypothetical protein